MELELFDRVALLQGLECRQEQFRQAVTVALGKHLLGGRQVGDQNAEGGSHPRLGGDGPLQIFELALQFTILGGADQAAHLVDAGRNAGAQGKKQDGAVTDHDAAANGSVRE